MDEYIKREDVISAICMGCNEEFSEEPCEPDCCAIRRAIKNIPTADVAPKSEVEFLRAAANLHEAEFEETKAELDLRNAEIETLKARLEVSKAEVAREIFEEIEEILRHDIGSLGFEILVSYDFEELKKKYTEGCTTCAHIVSCEPNPFGTCKEYEERHDE